MTPIGFGRTEITPPLGTPLRGYYHERLADSVLDPLYVRAIVWGEGLEAVVIVTCDLCMIDASWGEPARQAAAQAAGVAADRVLLNATHTHLGPESVPAVSARWPEQIARAVRMAIHGRTPCRISLGQARVPGIAFNRRYRMRDGGVETNPFGHEGMIEKPAGPVNERLNVLCFEDEAGRIHGLLTHFALHADTIGGCGVSADWPGLIETGLRTAQKDEELHVQTLIGPCGDVNHFNFPGGRAVKGVEEARRIVHTLVPGVVRALKSTREVSSERVLARTGVARLPVYRPSEAEARVAHKHLANHRDDPAKDFVLEIVAAKKVVKAAATGGDPISVPLQTFDFGQLAFLAVPMEVFVDVGTEIAKGLSKDVWIVTLANGYHGYLPSFGAFREGGYEVASSVLDPAAPTCLVTAARALLV